MLQPQKHGGYSDYRTILTDDCRGVPSGGFSVVNARSPEKVLSSDESVSHLKSDQSGVRYRWRCAVPRTSATGWPRGIAKKSLLWGNKPVRVLAERRAPALADQEI
jgi:hypothetical protein